MQGLYQWKLTGYDAVTIQKQLAEQEDYDKIDDQYFSEVLGEAIANADKLNEQLVPVLDRPPEELSPVEHAVLLLAAYEMTQRPEIPYRVVINEAVELTKSFGGAEGYKFVNGVLDKLAASVRAEEVQSKMESTKKGSGKR